MRRAARVDANQAEIDIGKNRQGPRGVITVRYEKAVNRFDELNPLPVLNGRVQEHELEDEVVF